MNIKILQKNWFILAIILTLFIAGFFPQFADVITSWFDIKTFIILILFFNIGFTLASEKIHAGLKDAKVHILNQIFIFVIIPVLIWLTAFPFKNVLDGQLIIGLYALAALPTTVSSCIVFTENSHGNSIAAIFNALISNVGGIFLSPIILSILLSTAGQQFSWDQIFSILLSLGYKMILPIIVGQIARFIIQKRYTIKKKIFSITNNILILIIVYLSLSKAISNEVLLGQAKNLPIPFIYLALMHLLFLGLIYILVKIFRFTKEDRAMTFFVAPQKTLAMGVPLLTAYFATQPELLGVALLPVLFYHPWQLFIAGFLQNQLIKQEK